MLGLGILFLSIPQVQAQESLNCVDFTSVLQFIEKQHLRFEWITFGERNKLAEDAIKGTPDALRLLGYPMLAEQFENIGLSATLKAIPKKNSFQVCEALKSSIFRAAFLKSYARSLDPYSDFYLPEELESKSSALEGEFVGVGIGTDVEGEFLRVNEVVPEGPADGKLFVGDKISTIDNHSVEGLNDAELRIRIRGEKGSIVSFAGERNDQPFRIEIVRNVVHQKSVSHSWGEDKVLFIKIHRFFRQTAQEVEQVVNSYGKQARGFILDLRNNPGGLLQGARDVVDLFVPQGVVVYLKGRGVEDQVWALKEGGEIKKPIVVLVNQGTASAAEIVAGALQDYGRAIVVGQRTYGKGSVQNIYETQTALGTKYQGGLKLTTLWYYLPSGKNVRSMRPDVVIKTKADHENLHPAMPYTGPDRIPVRMTQSLVAREKFNLKKADRLAKSTDDSEKLGRALLKETFAGSTR